MTEITIDNPNPPRPIGIPLDYKLKLVKRLRLGVGMRGFLIDIGA
ncbi:MAG: hypothetical protein QW057_04685 [Candidatus Bathyarchaeia archaeon]